MKEPRVKLLSVTPDAMTLLLRTKNTRLRHASDPAQWSDAEREEHLAYMRDTIRSSWEFVDYVFQIDNVTRAFTHQLVRTRAGSYAQESQRTVDVSDAGARTPVRVAAHEDGVALWEEAVRVSGVVYAALLEAGIPPGDARGVLPTNTLTSIVAKYSLRTLSAMAEVRLCTRTQGEYQDVFRAMRAAVLEVHPWAAPFIEVACVAHGTCAFPRYGRTSCPVWDPEMDNAALRERTRAKFWSIRHEATPVARGGKAS